MYSVAKSNSVEKKAFKEPANGSSKLPGIVNSSNGIPANGYNPLLGTFHTFETAPVPSSSPLNVNGCFRSLDDTDDHNGNSYGATVEYDSLSNNGSWSGESEDPKEKISQPPHQESVPGADKDKREKIRQKNERKHQRQKERRAQELHERCSGYLMSRKLEALAQQLVAMGFSQERATMALIQNDGRVEESVAWLFEGIEEDNCKEHNLDGEGNLKIDISEELARITDMEIRYKASKQEVERAIVACEGDLEKAEESLKLQKQEPSTTARSKPDTIGDPPIISKGKLRMVTNQNTMRIQVEAEPNLPAAIHLKREDKDFNCTNPITVGHSGNPGTKIMHSVNKIPPKLDWFKSQQITVPAEKKWAGTGSIPSGSYSSALPIPSKMDAQYLFVGNELKNLQLGSVREPPIVIKQPQTADIKQAPRSNVSSSPPGTAVGWYLNNIDTAKPDGLVLSVSGSRSISPNGVSPNLLHNQIRYQSQQQFLSNGNNSMDSQGRTKGHCLLNRGVSPTLSAASSLGLFSPLGTSGSSSGSSPVDWNTGCSILQFDYTNIDWSLDLGSMHSKPDAMWNGAGYSLQNNARAYDSFTYGLGVKSAMRPVLSNGSIASIPGLHEGVASIESSGNGSREWTSPFEEKDIFSLSRQFVSSPPL